MVNELTLVGNQEFAINYICADGTGITKGTILKHADPMTASASSGAADKLAGVCFGDKIASNGQTRVAVLRKGIFRARASGAIPMGEAVDSLGADNYIRRAPVTSSGTSILGHALETFSDNEEALIMVNVGAGGNHIS